MGELVRIIHPETLGEAEVDEGAMPHYYRSGWRLLTDEEQAARDVPEPDPDPVTREQAAELAAGATEPEEGES